MGGNNTFIFTTQNLSFSIPGGSERKEDNSELENLCFPKEALKY